MPKDWYEWHDLYDTEPKLQQRLEIVQEYIARTYALYKITILCINVNTLFQAFVNHL
ncbi:hypothetical protein NSTCB13_04787 [Nostoc sp. DSM 114160]|jgi:hypothetical protein